MKKIYASEFIKCEDETLKSIHKIFKNASSDQKDEINIFMNSLVKKMYEYEDELVTYTDGYIIVFNYKPDGILRNIHNDQFGYYIEIEDKQLDTKQEKKMNSLTVKEMIMSLSQYPEDAEVKITTIVDTNKLTEDDEMGCVEGIYYVESNIVGIEPNGFDDDIPSILSEDVNYIGCSSENCGGCPYN